MQIEPLTRIDQIKEGDLLLISDGREITHAKAQTVKVSEHDGTEVIFNLRKNKFFNVGMYLDARSWAKEVFVVRLGDPDPQIDEGWKEASIAWNVCASIHEKFAKGKDPLYSTRHADFIRHAEAAHAMIGGGQ